MSAIRYSTPQIEAYFRAHRVRWDDFYESERSAFERLNPPAAASVLDVGCGCGGLGLALRERFGITDYTGVEINEQAAATANTLNPAARIVSGDFQTLSADALADAYDLVVSLSCIDWNTGVDIALDKAYRLVRPGGHFLATFRMTDAGTIDDMSRSHQFIDYSGNRRGETAAYVVFNVNDLLDRLLRFEPAQIQASGYWGVPSATAVTPFERLCFAGIVVRKPVADAAAAPRLDLDLPPDLLGALRPDLRALLTVPPSR